MSATIIDAAWANQVQEELMALVIRPADIEFLETRRFAKVEIATPRLTTDLPDVPLHQRGFGVLDEGAQ